MNVSVVQIKKLNELLKTMDIPILRREDLRWLQRNLGIRNSNHPNFDEAMKLIKEMLK